MLGTAEKKVQCLQRFDEDTKLGFPTCLDGGSGFIGSHYLMKVGQNLKGHPDDILHYQDKISGNESRFSTYYMNHYTGYRA
jgi:hypothetical protein